MKLHKGAKKNSVRFDWEALWLAWGIGLVCSGIGILILWATLTDPEGDSVSTGFTLAQRLARTLPDSIQEKLAIVFAVLIILFGTICLFLGFKTIILFFLRNWRNKHQPDF